MKTATTLAAVFAAAPAFADAPGNFGGGYYDHMMGSGFGLVGGAMMLLFWGAIIVVAIIAARWLMERDAKPRQTDALETLRQRLARGEIDPEDYEARRKLLDS